MCRSGAGLEATRLLAETESRFARSDHLLFFLLRPTTPPPPPRPVYYILGYANRSTRKVIISLLARHNPSFATTPPALAAAAQTRIAQGTSWTLRYPRSTAHLAAFLAMTIVKSRNMCSASLNAWGSLMGRSYRLRHAQNVAPCI